MIQLNKYFQKEIQLVSETSIRFCNPSIIKKDNYWIVLIRGIEENKKIRNRKGFFYNENWIFKYNEQFNLIEKYIIDDNELIENNKECQFGLEDGRIFEWENELWVIFTGLDIVDNKFINTMCLAQLQDRKLINFKILKSPYNLTREKNWIPLVKNKDLYIIYQSNPVEVYKYEKDELKLIIKKQKKFSKFFISGSSVAIPFNEHLMFVTHHREKINFFKGLFLRIKNKQEYKRKKIIFFHQIHLINSEFNKITSSDKFIFEKKGIEFCAGLAIENENVLLSYGVEDKDAKVVTINLRDIFRNLSIQLNLIDKGWKEVINNNIQPVNVDLLILNYNNFDRFAKACLDSLMLNELTNTTLYLLDNGSQDDSVSKIREYCENKPIKSYFSETNLGFAKGMNYLANQGNSEWLLLVNSDVILPKDIISKLSNILSNITEDIAAVGPISNEAGNEQKYLIEKNTQTEILSQLERISYNQTNLLIDVFRLDFFFVAIRRKVWNQLNGLDEIFGLGYYEDFDFCLRVKELGKKVVISEDLYVYHFGSGSFSDRNKILIKNNKIKLLKKHTKTQFPHIRESNLNVLLKYKEIIAESNKFNELLSVRMKFRILHLYANLPRSLIKKIIWFIKIKAKGF